MQVNQWLFRLGVCGLTGLVLSVSTPMVSAADTKAEKAFTIAVTDAQGVETELKNGIFY